MPEKTYTSLKPHSNASTIVGIGASAGGLAALKTFFRHVPENSGLTFVVVVHLSSDHESHMADLIQPYVKMPVQQVTYTTLLKPDHVYIIPPGYNLNSIDTHLRLSRLEQEQSKRAPIDHFFRTLAFTHDGHAVGIILTGTGSDGTLGIKDIKGNGGLTIVQAPIEAEYDGMPQSALATGMIDLILPLAKMPEYILHFAHTSPHVEVPKEGEEMEKADQQLLQKVFTQVRALTGRDFNRYKRSTIMRRIQRRMQLSQIEELKDYLILLREKPEELQALSDEFLITVTHFFRDAEVFRQLEEKVIPGIFRKKEPDKHIRVWSVGCATGEEAYSLAMLLLEEADRNRRSGNGKAQYKAPVEIKVFASDLHTHSLQKAREGFYPGDIEADVSPERLQKFFLKEEGGYRIRKEVRELVTFASHNLLGDPPFSRVDLISCRNVLIYLQREVQRHVIDLFHYALIPEGFLLLGTSETIETQDLFNAEDKKHCLFRKRNVPLPEPRLPVFPITKSKLSHTEMNEPQAMPPIAYGILHQQIVERYAPPSLVVGPDHKVVHLSEHVGRYLVHPGGEVTTNLFKLVREEFRSELMAALHVAKEKGISTQTKPIPLQIEGKSRSVVLSVFPAGENLQKGFAVVIFDEQVKRNPPKMVIELAPGVDTPGVDTPGTHKQDPSPVSNLQRELNYTRQQLRNMIEKYETSQEEMKVSNEEMQSINEELRSTLEELETSKEELQSTNEELTTINQENRHKVEELTQISGDLQNLLMATDIATVFLDRQLRILRFTPRLGEIFNVRITDQGRPLSDLTHRLGYKALMNDARQVLHKLTPLEREIQDETHRWFLTRILPYRSIDDHIEGVVITFVEITALKQAEKALLQAKNYAEQIVASVPEPLLVLSSDLFIQTANQTFYDTFKVQPKDTEGQKIYDLGNRQWNIPALRKLLEEVLPEDNRFHNYEVTRDFVQIGNRSMLLSGRRLEDVQLILLAIKDITELKQAETRAEQATKAKDEFLAHMSHEIRTPLNAILGLSELLLQQNPQPSQLENLNTLKFSAGHLKRLVTDILDFSKIQADKVRVEETDVHLPELMHSLQKAHESLAKEKGNALEFHVDGRIPEVRTDQLKLSQVLHNLIGNAVKFTQQGLVKVEARLNQKKGNRLWVDFSVRDTGVGIPANKLSRIFDAFTQLDISTVRPYEGTGLGLSITKSLLKLMGSQIEVESTLREGSRFFFTLPMKKSRAAAPSTVSIPSHQKEAGLQNISVLLVEDTNINRIIIVQFLKEWWHLVPDEATNGKQAITRAKKKQYDLILMDIRMPVMDGYQTTKAIRALPDKHNRQVPIIAMTADTAIELKKHAEAALFTDVLIKPFDPDQLQQTIIRYAPKEKKQPISSVASLPAPKRKQVKGKGGKGRRSGTPAPPPAYEIDFGKAEAIFDHDTQEIKLFLKETTKEFIIYQQQFTTALTARDKAALSNLKHKLGMLMDMLAMQELEGWLEQCQSLLQENAPPEQIDEARQKGEAMMEKILDSLKKYQEPKK